MRNGQAIKTAKEVHKPQIKNLYSSCRYVKRLSRKFFVEPSQINQSKVYFSEKEDGHIDHLYLGAIHFRNLDLYDLTKCRIFHSGYELSIGLWRSTNQRSTETYLFWVLITGLLARWLHMVNLIFVRRILI